MVRAPAPGTGGSRVRFLPGPRAGVARCTLHFTATCAEQLAQSKLHRATCADQLAPTSLRRAPCLEQLAQSNLRRATCTEQLAQSSLHRATCRERNLHRATCRDQLAGATCAEQLAQSNLHSATRVEQLAQTNLHRPVCAEHLAWCCLALASRSVGKKNASCSVGPTSLAMFCFRANRGLVFFFLNPDCPSEFYKFSPARPPPAPRPRPLPAPFISTMPLPRPLLTYCPPLPVLGLGKIKEDGFLWFPNIYPEKVIPCIAYIVSLCFDHWIPFGFFLGNPKNGDSKASTS